MGLCSTPVITGVAQPTWGFPNTVLAQQIYGRGTGYIGRGMDGAVSCAIAAIAMIYEGSPKRHPGAL